MSVTVLPRPKRDLTVSPAIPNSLCESCGLRIATQVVEAPGVEAFLVCESCAP